MNFSAFLQTHQTAEPQLLVWAFIPFRADGFYGDSYDSTVTQTELAHAFETLGVEWRWQPITLNNFREAVETVLSGSDGRLPVVLNYCDGDEVNGFPGLSVVRLLEEKGLVFTGARSRFYEISTSKVWMKQLFEQANVPTPPFAEVNGEALESAGICERLGVPLIVKPSVSAGSWGLTLKSVVHTDAELQEQAQRLKHGIHGKDFSVSSIYAERFVKGAEYTVFVVGSADLPENKRIYPPLERAINRNLPETERFLSFERYWQKYAEEAPLPAGEALYENRLADPARWEPLMELAWQAHCAVYGTGYSRVDIRVEEATNQPFVLEVNANCGISSPDDDTSVGRILNFTGLPFSTLIAEILADALRRHFAQKQAEAP